MAADKVFRKPSLNVVQGDELGPTLGVIGANATAAYMIPGKIVVYDTNDNEVKEASTDSSGNVGILGYEKSPILFKPATRDTAYAVGDHVAIHNTPGMKFRGWLAPGTAAVKMGAALMHDNGDTSGNFQLYLGPTTSEGGNRIAKALESVDPSGVDAAKACWMQWLG